MAICVSSLDPESLTILQTHLYDPATRSLSQPIPSIPTASIENWLEAQGIKLIWTRLEPTHIYDITTLLDGKFAIQIGLSGSDKIFCARSADELQIVLTSLKDHIVMTNDTSNLVKTTQNPSVEAIRGILEKIKLEIMNHTEFSTKQSDIFDQLMSEYHTIEARNSKLLSRLREAMQKNKEMKKQIEDIRTSHGTTSEKLAHLDGIIKNYSNSELVAKLERLENKLEKDNLERKRRKFGIKVINNVIIIGVAVIVAWVYLAR